MNIKVLIAAADYPDNNGKVTLMYIHTRNLYYAAHGINVTVLNFKAKKDYEKDGIWVINPNTYKLHRKEYDILILHAANIKNHYLFLKRYGNDFRKYIFFYHGHEVLRCNSVYSKPYPYVRRSIIKKVFQDVYDTFKLSIWRFYLPKVKYKSHFIFVSNWMKEEFHRWTHIPEMTLEGHYSITYNSIGEEFEHETFDSSMTKEFDFCTIRSNLDGSKYSVDILNNLAKNTPNRKFVVVGKGTFFQHYSKAANITWLNQTLTHEEIVELLQKSRFALMPTRTDAQGLMMCEMAAFGIPLITSDIPVCHEVFEDFENVYLINNDTCKSLNWISNDKCVCKKHTKYYKEVTVKSECEMIKGLIE